MDNKVRENIVMTDELIDALGNVFVHQKIHERYGMTFEQYIDRWKRGTLHLFIY